MRDRVFSNFLEEKKLITTLVNSATSFSDVLRRAGFAKRNTRRAAAIKRVSKELGLDISHFYPQFSSDQKLADAVKQSKSYSDVCKILGKRPGGNRQAYFKLRIQNLGLDVSHFVNGGLGGAGWAKGLTSSKRKSAEEILVLRPKRAYRAKGYLLRRALLDLGVKEQCAKCGLGPLWQGTALILQVDHIDGNYRDCRLHNLRFMCPNCHAQTPTYKNYPR